MKYSHCCLLYTSNGTPVIAIDRKVPGLQADIVVEDNRDSSYQLVEALIQKGHTEIAVNNVLMNISSGKERLEGVRMACLLYTSGCLPVFC